MHLSLPRQGGIVPVKLFADNPAIFSTRRKSNISHGSRVSRVCVIGGVVVVVVAGGSFSSKPSITNAFKFSSLGLIGPDSLLSSSSSSCVG